MIEWFRFRFAWLPAATSFSQSGLRPLGNEQQYVWILLPLGRQLSDDIGLYCLYIHIYIHEL